MPARALAWRLAWWLMRRVVMRGYTPYQQAKMIDTALGAYRPKPVPGITVTSGTNNRVINWRTHC